VAERWLREDVKPNGFVVKSTGLGDYPMVGFLHPCFAPHNFSAEPKPLELFAAAPAHEPDDPYMKAFVDEQFYRPAAVKPLQLSSGFHQVAPIVVQAGVMRRGELLCIENPEVHLHPSLQTRICEFLIGEARCGKQILIETHSDLVVYRVLRAILKETLPQEWVRIYFTSLHRENVPDQVRWTPNMWLGDQGETWTKGLQATHSEVERIKIDERGRVSNWPPGFLDESVSEARLLLDLMYGGSPESEGGEP
jgi:hypothetical protein